MIAAKDDAIAKLNQELMWYKRKMFGHSSEKLHQDDPNQLLIEFEGEKLMPLTDSQLEEEAQRVEETKAEVHKEAESRRTQKKAALSRKGQTYHIGPEVPRQTPVDFYPEGYDAEKMVIIGWNQHEYLEIEGPKVSVRVEREAICKLKTAKPTDIKTEIFEAKGSQNCLPGCIAGNKTMATIIVDKYCNHLPEYRQAKRLKDMGVILSTTSINRWQHDLADNLYPLYAQQVEVVFSSKYLHLDESTIPINDQKGKTRKGYIWDAADGMGESGLAFFYEKGSRGGKVLQPKLLHRKTAIQSDGYAVYENIEKSQLEGIVTLYCMAHARRKFEQIKDTSAEARKVLEYISTLYELEANLKFRQADHDEIYRERQEKAVPILRFIKLLLEKYQTIDTPASALVNACKYALDRWDGLCRYCAIQVLRIYFAETSLRHEEGRLPGTAYISSGRSHRQEIILIGQEQRRRHLLFEGDAAIFVWGRQMKCGMVTFLPTPNKMPCGLEFITQPQGKYYRSKRVKYMRNVLISLLIIPITFSFPINQESNKA